MLFEVAPESSARRVAEALVAAEAERSDAWRLLDDAALLRLRSDGTALAERVPWAMLALAEQLAAHPRSTVRIEAVRLLGIVYQYGSERVRAALLRLTCDSARGVERAARQLLARCNGDDGETADCE